MGDLLASIRKRKLIQWVAAYGAAAWVVLQVLDILGDMWAWPTVVGRIAFVALATGLGLTVVAAWFHGERGHQRLTFTEASLVTMVLGLGGLAAGAVLRGGGIPVETESRPDVAALPSTSLAVLPFEDLSPGGGRDYLGDGIAETLISGLSRLETLRVVARTSAFEFRDFSDIREIGRRLGAGSIVEGTVTQVGNRVRITANLVDTGSGESIWAEKFDDEAEATDLFDLQDKVARKIVEALRVRLAGANRIVGGGTRSPEAQKAFFLGQHHWTLRTTEDMEIATQRFREAIAADSTYAEAWGGLALAYTLSTPQEYAVPGITREEALAKAQAAALRAIELDPSLASAYAAMGDALWQSGDLDAGERWMRQALERNPGYATAHHWLADILMTKLDGEAALREIDAAEALDPVAPAILVERAEALMMLGRHAEALAQIEKTVALLPEAPLGRTFGAYFYLVLGDWERGAEYLGEAAALLGNPEEGARLRDAILDPARRAGLMRAWADVGAPRVGWSDPVDTQMMGRPELRFIATKHLDGDSAAMDLLEQIVSGPEAAAVYPPLLPALLGPELLKTEQAQRIMRLTHQRR